MWKFLAVLALTLNACSGPSGDGGPDKGHPTDGIDTGTHVEPTGSMFVHATNPSGSTVNAQVNDLDGNFLGNTEETITGLTPGQLQFTLGDPGMTTLDGVPFHVISDDSYLTGGGSASISLDQIAQAEIHMSQAGKYHCSYTDCDPYLGSETPPSNCNGNSYADDPQYISMDASHHLHGAQNNSFGGQGSSADVWTLEDGDLTFESGDPGTKASYITYDAEDLSFNYMLTNEAFSVALTVDCHL